MSTISIVVATRNRLDQLKVALPSMFAQEGVLEILVADDGSTDGSKEWLREQGIPFLNYTRAKYSLNPKVYTPLIKDAKGDIIIFSGGEICCPDPTGVLRLASRCSPKTIAQARVYNSLTPEGGEPSEDWVVNNDPKTWKSHGHDKIVYTGPERPAPYMFFAAFPKQIWLDVGGYNPKLKKNVDGDFAARAMKQGIIFQGVGSVIAYHLTHPKI